MGVTGSCSRPVNGSTASTRSSSAVASGSSPIRRRTGGASSTSRSTTASWTWWSGHSTANRRRSAVEVDPRRRRGRSARRPLGSASTPGTASGARSAGSQTADGSRRSARARRDRRTCGCCRCPGVAPSDARPRQVTTSLPAIVGAALAPGRVPATERIAFTARDGLRIEGNLWRPVRATGKRGGERVPTIVSAHGGPTDQAYRSFRPLRFHLVREGFAYLDVGLPRLDRLRARVPACQPRRVGPRGRPRRDRCSTVGDRAAVVGRTAGRLRRLVRRVPGAVGARRGAIDVAGRHRPVRRLGDRRELPPRRPARAPGPPADDGLPGRPGAAPSCTAADPRSTVPSGSRRRCSSSTAEGTGGSCRS